MIDGLIPMAKRINYAAAEDAWIDVSSTVYDLAVSRAMAEDMTVEEAVKEVLTSEIESVE